jgi:hypothetical protein
LTHFASVVSDNELAGAEDVVVVDDFAHEIMTSAAITPKTPKRLIVASDYFA